MNREEEYFIYAEKIGNRHILYQLIQKTFDIKSALYPGSHIDIAPSFYIEDVTYVDNFKGTIKFFSNLNEINKIVDKYKDYSEVTRLEFVGADYNKFKCKSKFDLIISQYAGFVGQATKDMLKTGGILLCNDSHGDATLAYCDADYEFIGVITNDSKISTLNLDQYFKFKRERAIDTDAVLEKMKGPQYKLQIENYVFRKNI
jgi:hypothetical protein